jgi:hypothetical protein
VTAQARVPDFDPDAVAVDVILRSSAQAARTLGNFATAWQGEVVLPGTVVMRPGRPLPSKPPPPVESPLRELSVAKVIAALDDDPSVAAAARLELADRIELGELAPDLVRELVDRALTLQASDEPWANGWGDIVERAWGAGAIDDVTFTRYARGAFRGAAALETRARVRVGAIIPYRIRFGPARAGSGTSDLRVHVATPVTVHLDGEQVTSKGWGASGSPPRLATPTRLRRISGSVAGPVAPSTLSFAVEADALPVDCAFLAFARSADGTEHAIGQVIINRGEAFRSAFMVPAAVIGEGADEASITFILRSDRSTAERSIGIERIWDGELTITPTARETK